MKIKYLKINNFGKLNNKEINLNKNINLIYGKNESGKTTLLKFITSMLYGVSRNKNGKEMSDFDRYSPWNGENFSGKIGYELDNNDSFEVFREFKKKSPKIFNNNLEDISNNYTVDKNRGNQFFYEQTKIDETVFLSTTVVEQQGVVLDENKQKLLTQKISNLLSSGSDTISYNKVLGNLSKKAIEEVGTDRTVDRPLNNVVKEINNIENEIALLEEFKNKNISLNDERKKLKEEISNLENKLKLLNHIKEIKENENIEEEKIKINNSIKEEYDQKISLLNNNINNNLNNKKELKNKKNNKMQSITYLLLFICIILNILFFTNVITVSNIIKYSILIITTLIMGVNLFIFINSNNKNKKLENDLNVKRIKEQNELEILEENRKNKEKEIEQLKYELLSKQQNNLQILKNNFIVFFDENELLDLLNKQLKEIKIEINLIENELNNKKIYLNTLDIQEINSNEKLENYSSLKERLKYLYNEKENLLSLNKSINLAKEVLEISYNKMKNEITPKFTKDLSKLISKISDGKYKNVNFDADVGLTVELDNGDYINSNKLSIGTIDQLYLSLRLSSMQEIAEENMPIILDETFAYYDDERLENILKYLNDNYTNNQIIIFTCSNREKEIFKKLDINYNFIEL